MDLSVTHDNAAAIAALREAGLPAGRRCWRSSARTRSTNRCSPHPPETVDDLNPYARIIADEAMRRGIRVEVLDAGAGRCGCPTAAAAVVTRESLSEFTSAVAMSRCDDKRLTRRIVGEAGIMVRAGRLATFDEADHDVPRRGRRRGGQTDPGRAGQGHHRRRRRDADELDAALARAREQHPDVLIEQRAEGDDLRLVVIDGKVVAAAVRRPAEIVGTGTHTVRRAHRGTEPAPRRRHRRRVTHPARRGHRGDGGRRRVLVRRRPTRG